MADEPNGTPNADPAPDPAPAVDPAKTTLGGEPPKAPDPAPKGDAPPAGDAPWHAAIPDEQTRTFAQRFASPVDLATWALEQRRAAATSIRVPGKDAKPEDVAAFHKALGVPETPDGYEIALPEGVELDDAGKARMDAFKAAMHAKGATPAAVSAAFETYQAFVQQEMTARAEAIESARASQKKTWGPEYDRNVELAKRAVRTFGDAGLAQMLETNTTDGVPLGEHPALIEAFAKIGRRMGEGSMLSVVDKSEAADLESRRKEIHAMASTAPEKYRSKEIQDELRSIYDRLGGGNQPIVGAAGRVA